MILHPLLPMSLLLFYVIVMFSLFINGIHMPHVIVYSDHVASDETFVADPVDPLLMGHLAAKPGGRFRHKPCYEIQATPTAVLDRLERIGFKIVGMTVEHEGIVYWTLSGPCDDRIIPISGPYPTPPYTLHGLDNTDTD